MAIERLHGIVTDVLKHSDRHNVVTLYTRERGRVALLANAGGGKTARMRNAQLMPLSVIETDVNVSATRELQFLGRFSRPLLWHDLYFDPVKSAVGLFTAEFLNVFLRQSPPDARLWDYVVKAVTQLDSMKRGIANFHLAFLIEFLAYAGITPDTDGWQPGAWFDLRAGSFSALPPGHRDVAEPDDAGFMPLLARMTTANAPAFRFSVGQRRRLLTGLLRYYSVHFPGLSSLKSPEVLQELFA